MKVVNFVYSDFVNSQATQPTDCPKCLKSHGKVGRLTKTESAYQRPTSCKFLYVYFFTVFSFRCGNQVCASNVYKGLQDFA